MAEHTFLQMEKDGYLAYCEVCKSAQLLQVPMSIEDFLFQIEAFAEKHRDCRLETDELRDVGQITPIKL